MQDINTVAIVGRVAKDAELRHTNGGTATTTFPIASNRRRKVNDNWEDETSFIDIQLWGKTAETLAPKLSKGKQIAISGSLRQERWEQNGQTRSKLIVVADSVEFMQQAQGGDTYGF